MNKPFWALPHDEFGGAVRMHRLIGAEATFVYLIMADETYGWGKPDREISLAKISRAAGIGIPNVVRALKRLGDVGLYEQTTDPVTRKVTRMVRWPVPMGTIARTVAATVTTIAPVMYIDDKKKEQEEEKKNYKFYSRDPETGMSVQDILDKVMRRTAGVGISRTNSAE